MKGRIPGFSYNPKKHLARFSLYVPRTNGKPRRERTVHTESREEAIRLWQAFRDEISGKPPASEPSTQPRVITFGTFVTEYLEKICARRAKKTLDIYRTIAFTRLVPHFGEKPLDTIRSCDVEDFMAMMLGECSPAYVNNCARTMKALLPGRTDETCSARVPIRRALAPPPSMLQSPYRGGLLDSRSKARLMCATLVPATRSRWGVGADHDP